MDIAGRKKTKVGTCIRDEKPLLVRVARTLRGMLDDVIEGAGESPSIRNLLEYAAQNLIIEGVSSEEPGIEQKDFKPAESVTTCAHSCAHHAKLMDIALWSQFPEELQELVFARLPWSQIFQARILSKDWNQKLSGAKDSQFKQACVRAKPKSFAVLVQGTCAGSIQVNMFDISCNRWHAFETSPDHDPKCDEIKIGKLSASDGGLVCFVLKEQSGSKNTSRHVFVCNPLTRVWKQLPPLYGIVQRQVMVQLIMDRVTKHYRVIVVGYCKDPQVRNVVKVYHSETGKWTKAAGSASGEVVHGFLYESRSLWMEPTACSYNFADGVVHEMPINFPRKPTHDLVLVKDHLFCLKDATPPGGLPTHCIEEYEAVDCEASWTFLKEYTLCSWTLPTLPSEVSCSSYFFASKDFLLVFVYHEWGYGLNLRELHTAWLYEFSAEEWHELPEMPACNLRFLALQICELRIDSVP